MIGKRFLVVSDDRVLVEFVRKNAGGQVLQMRFPRAEGRQLTATVCEEHPDLVVVDIMMPWMDGIGLSLRLRQSTDVPVMLLSAWGAGKNRVRGLDLSAESYLTEPYDGGELSERIEEALRRNGMRAEVVTSAAS